MTDRTVTVRMQMIASDYMTNASAAGKATTAFADQVDKAKGRAAQGYQSMGRGAMVAGGLVLAGFGLAEHEMASFENRMQLVATLSHASAAEMRQLHAAALTVGQAYGFTATQVADAEAELVKAGVSVRDIMGGALTGALTLAAAGQTDVASATTIAATAMTQFGLSGKDVPHIADLLASGADKALGSVTDLGYALDQAGPQAHQFHVSIEETVGTLAAFAQAGQIGERGGTVFSQMLIKLAAPGKEASDTLKSLGITLYDTQGRFVGMSNLAGQLQTKMSGLSEEERNHALAVIFGARAIRGANILYQDGAKGIADWTRKVNDSGFAALQAAGKMNSLSGDVTKFKSALQVALIGAGEGANGPLRTLVQDATGVVRVWTELPGPVRGGAEALLLAGGAATFAGGAALLAIPKWSAMNAAIVASGRSAITVRGALAGAGKATAVGAAVFGLYEGAKALGHLLAEDSTPSVNQFTDALVNLQNNLHPADDGLIQLATTMGKFSHTDAAGMLPDMVKNLDAALAGLVTQGHAETAATDFARMSDAMHAAGMSTAAITRLFPAYASALSSSATSAQVAGNGVDEFGNKMSAAATATDKATQAAKDYNDTLHAMADPVFGLAKALADVKKAQDAANDAAAGGKSKDALTAHKELVDAERAYAQVTHEKKPNADTVASALSRVRDAQHAYTAAVKAHLPNSAAAKQANLDLATASLDVTTAASTLSGALKGNPALAQDMADQLRTWQREGLLTKRQADDVATSLGIVIRKAHTLDGSDIRVKVKADVKGALNGLDAVQRAAEKLAPLLGPLSGFTPSTPNAGGLSGLLGAAIPQPRYQSAPSTPVMAGRITVPQSNSNTTNVYVAGNIDSKAIEEQKRKQRYRRAVL